MPTTVWKKIPRITRPCACGCGVMVTGTKSKKYARPYCKLKMHLQRKKAGLATKLPPRLDPIARTIPFSLGEMVDN